MVVPPLRPVFSIDKEGEGKCMHRQKLVIRCQMRRWTTSLPLPSTYFELVMRASGGAPGIDTVLREGPGVPPEVPGAVITLGQQLVQARNAHRPFASGWGPAPRP